MFQSLFPQLFFLCQINKSEDYNLRADSHFSSFLFLLLLHLDFFLLEFMFCLLFDLFDELLCSLLELVVDGILRKKMFLVDVDSVFLRQLKHFFSVPDHDFIEFCFLLLLDLKVVLDGLNGLLHFSLAE